MDRLGVDQLYVKRFAIVVFSNWLATSFSKLIFRNDYLLYLHIISVLFGVRFAQFSFFVKTVFHRYFSYFFN